MNNYIATRKRAYWVEETMYIEAESVEEAQHTFYNDFCVELEVKDVFALGDKQFDEGVKIVKAPTNEEIEKEDMIELQQQLDAQIVRIHDLSANERNED